MTDKRDTRYTADELATIRNDMHRMMHNIRCVLDDHQSDKIDLSEEKQESLSAFYCQIEKQRDAVQTMLDRAIEKEDMARFEAAGSPDV
jgi:hypothetical protein